MPSLWERERVYRRRLALSAAVVALLHVGLWLLPAPQHPRLRTTPSDAPAPGSLSLQDVEILGWPSGGGGDARANPDRPTSPIPFANGLPEPAMEAAPPVTTATPPPPADVATPEPSASEPPAVATSPSLRGTPADSLAGIAAAGSGTGSSSGSEGGTAGSGAAVMRPRVLVQPRVPAQIIARRKIDDFVVLQALVDPGGRVQQVRVLRPIPNCEECTRAAVEAAQQYRYDPPVLPADAPGVWTQPFDIGFSYRR